MCYTPFAITRYVTHAGYLTINDYMEVIKMTKTIDRFFTCTLSGCVLTIINLAFAHLGLRLGTVVDWNRRALCPLYEGLGEAACYSCIGVYYL